VSLPGFATVPRDASVTSSASALAASYEKHDPAGRNRGNSRNGIRSKTVLTEIGPVEIDVPRDIDASFQPRIVRKRQRRLTGVAQIVLSLSARGLTTSEISAHFAEVYGASVSKDTVSVITDQVIEEMTRWMNRPPTSPPGGPCGHTCSPWRRRPVSTHSCTCRLRPPVANCTLQQTSPPCCLRAALRAVLGP
jgi:hypothetical protein